MMPGSTITLEDADTEEQRREKLGLIKQADNKNFVKKRNNARILRFKRFSKVKDFVDWRRVEMMLYYPWRNESKELEDDNNCETLYKNEFETVISNKKHFESVVAENYDKVQQEVEREIEEHYEQLNAPDIERAHNAHTYLMQNTFIDRTDDLPTCVTRSQEMGIDREELEDEFGYRAELQRIDDICQVTVDKESHDFKMPDVWPDDK